MPQTMNNSDSNDDQWKVMSSHEQESSFCEEITEDAYEEECVICLEELTREDDGWGRCTPCNHAFHKKCWWKWENAHHQRAERIRRQGNSPEHGPTCCLCNTVAEKFVDGTGTPAHNPEPYVASSTGEYRDPTSSFFDRFVRRPGDNYGDSDRGSTGNGSFAAFQPREFLERMVEQGGSIMGMDAGVLRDQMRFGGDWGSNPSNERSGRSESGRNDGAGLDFNLGHIFGQGFADGGTSGARRRNSNAVPAASFNEIQSGTPVAIQHLLNSLHLNGQQGKVQQFQQQTGRYLVLLDSNNAIISVKSENILQIVNVTILGLVSQPQLNGREGIIRSYNKERNRYIVRIAYLPSETKEISIQPSNIRVPDGTRVRLEGLERQPQWNGRYGTVLAWEDGRYEVRLSHMYSVRVRGENVRL